MEQKQINFSASLAFGQDGEHTIGEELRKCGYTILPLYQFNASSAPQMFTSGAQHTSPDIIAFKDGTASFFEVKRKNRWIHYIDGQSETGLNTKHLSEYKHLSEATGIQCFIIFIHEKEEPTGIYMTNVNNNLTRSWDGKNCYGDYISRPETLYNRDNIKKLK